MKVLYTGSFNPFHNGHQYVYDLICKMFGKDNVWIGIGQRSSKPDPGKDLLKFSMVPITTNVITYDTLTARVVNTEKFELLVRGIRPGQSIEDETQLLYWNKELCGVDTILIPTPPEVNQISSGAIRELVAHNYDVTKYMNQYVYQRWLHKSEPRIPVFFGRCCSGKTTYLYKKCTFNVVEFDKQWSNPNVLDLNDSQIEACKMKLKQLFYLKDQQFILYMRYIISNHFNWDEFMKLFKEPYYVFDMPVVGLYFDLIPVHIRSRMELTKVETSEDERAKFAEFRGVNPNLIECNDHFYRDPPFWDHTVHIKMDKKGTHE